jgi:hypothetical protein
MSLLSLLESPLSIHPEIGFDAEEARQEAHLTRGLPLAWRR